MGLATTKLAPQSRALWIWSSGVCPWTTITGT